MNRNRYFVEMNVGWSWSFFCITWCGRLGLGKEKVEFDEQIVTYSSVDPINAS